MIIVGSRLHVVDNTGAKSVECIKVLGGSKKRYATVGDTIVVSIKDSIPSATVKKGEVAKAVIVSLKKRINRYGNVFVRFDKNAVVIVNNQDIMRGSRVLGPVSRSVKADKVASRAWEVI